MGLPHCVQDKHRIDALLYGFRLGRCDVDGVLGSESPSASNRTTIRIRIRTKTTRTITQARGRTNSQSHPIGTRPMKKESFSRSPSPRNRKSFWDRQTGPCVPNTARDNARETSVSMDGTILDCQRFQQNIPAQHIGQGNLEEVGQRISIEAIPWADTTKLHRQTTTWLRSTRGR